MNWLELQAIFLCLQHFFLFFPFGAVASELFSDNTTAITCILHQGNLRSDPLMLLHSSTKVSVTPIQIFFSPKVVCDQSNCTDFNDPRTLMQIGFFEYKKHIKLFKWIESVYAFLYSYYSNQIHIS